MNNPQLNPAEKTEIITPVTRLYTKLNAKNNK